MGRCILRFGVTGIVEFVSQNLVILSQTEEIVSQTGEKVSQIGEIVSQMEEIVSQTGGNGVTKVVTTRSAVTG